MLLEIISDSEAEKKKKEEKENENYEVKVNEAANDIIPDTKIISDDKDLMSFSAEYHKRSIVNAKNDIIQLHENKSEDKKSMNQEINVPKRLESTMELKENQFENIEEKGKYLLCF